MAKSRQAEGNALIGALLALCWIFVGLRVYVRAFMSKAFGADDWLLLVALAMYTTYCASALAAVVNGVGLPPELFPQEKLPNALYFWWLAVLFYVLTTVFVRASISVFLHKLCVKKVHKVIIWTTMAVVVLYSTFYFFLAMFQCKPYSFFWERYLRHPGKCLTPSIFSTATYVHSGISAVADWTLGLLPIWVIWGLQMNMRTKVSVAVILGLGVVAGVAALIRVPYVRDLGNSNQFLFAVVDVSLWSLAEAALGIIAASASALRPLFKRFYQLSGYGTRSKSRTRTRTHTNTHPYYPSRGAYVRNQSSAGTAADRDRDLYKEDSLELGVGVGSEARATGGEGVGVGMGAGTVVGGGADASSRSGSEENLTGRKDIYVHTVIEVNTGNRGGNGNGHGQK